MESKTPQNQLVSYHIKNTYLCRKTTLNANRRHSFREKCTRLAGRKTYRFACKLTSSEHHTQSGDSRIQSAQVPCASHRLLSSGSTMALETARKEQTTIYGSVAAANSTVELATQYNAVVCSYAICMQSFTHRLITLMQRNKAAAFFVSAPSRALVLVHNPRKSARSLTALAEKLSCNS